MIIKNGKRLDGFCVDSLPIGTLQPYLGLKAPNGYLICDGSLISKTVYPDLYIICGNLFGTESDTHFRLPDLRGKTIAGYNESDSTMNTIGKLLGSTTHKHTTGNHTLTINEIPDHSHQFYTTPNSHNAEWIEGVQRYFYDVSTVNDSDTYTGGTSNNGGSQPHNHGDTGVSSSYQPTMVANWIVKAKMIVPVTAYVENTLDSVSESNALSAAQGKVLNDKISSLSTVANTGSYNDLINKPERVDYISQITCNYGTLNSNFNYCFLKDDVVYLNLTYTLNTALTAGTQYDFCKIPAAIRPKGNVIMYAFSHTVSHMITNYVRSTGELVIAPEKNVPAGKEINMWTVYYIK